MARTAKKVFKINIKPLIEITGIIDELVSDPKFRKKSLAKLIKDMSPAERAELKRNLE